MTQGQCLQTPGHYTRYGAATWRLGLAHRHARRAEGTAL